MALVAQRLYYRKGGTTYPIKLYSTPGDVGDGLYLPVRTPGGVAYAQGGYPGDYRATHLRYRKGGTVYAVLDGTIPTSQGGVYYPGFNVTLNGSEATYTVYSTTFEVPRTQTVTLNSRVAGYNNQGAKSDWWCWTYIYTYLDGSAIGSTTLLRSSNGYYDRWLYSGTTTLGAGSHTLSLVAVIHASGGDHNQLTIDSWTMNATV